MASVPELIELALQTGEYTLAWSSGIQTQAIELDTQATAELRAFKPEIRAYPGNGQRVTELHPRAKQVPRQATHTANLAWCLCGGHDNPERAHLILAAARIEYTRAALHSVLWYVGMITTRDIRVGKSILSKVLQDAKARNWSDADAISRRPISFAWVDESAANTFSEWCSNYDYQTEAHGFEHRAPARDVTPKITPEEMFSAIALSWIDEAVYDPLHCLGLMAEVADLMQSAGHYGGWAGHEEVVAQERSAWAKAAAAKRHAQNNVEHQKAIDHYMRNSYPSKDAAAQAIAGAVVHRSCRQVREWLIGLPDARQTAGPSV